MRRKGRALMAFLGVVNNLPGGAADEPTWGEKIEHRSSEKQNQEVPKFVVYCNFNITSFSLKYLPKSVIAGLLPQIDYKHHEV